MFTPLNNKTELFHTRLLREPSHYTVHFGFRYWSYSPMYITTLNISGFSPPKNKTYRAPPTQFIFLSFNVAKYITLRSIWSTNCSFMQFSNLFSWFRTINKTLWFLPFSPIFLLMWTGNTVGNLARMIKMSTQNFPQNLHTTRMEHAQLTSVFESLFIIQYNHGW